MKRTALRRQGKRARSRVGMQALLRKVVIARDKGCLMAGTSPCSGPLQAAHILPQGQFPSLRYELRNVVTLCARHHIYGGDAWHRSPLAAFEWAEIHFGKAHLECLRELALARKPRSDLKAMKLFLEQELARYE